MASREILPHTLVFLKGRNFTIQGIRGGSGIPRGDHTTSLNQPVVPHEIFLTYSRSLAIISSSKGIILPMCLCLIIEHLHILLDLVKTESRSLVIIKYLAREFLSEWE
jgi:hypothetical protein